MTPSTMVPTARPEMGRRAAEQLLIAHGIDTSRPAILGRRGYYRDALGVPGANDIGIYDDAIILVTPTAYLTCNANCDPSRHHPGVAVLQAGVWRYKLGIHNASKDPALHPHYEALVQAGPVTVRRDPDASHVEPWLDTGWFGINIHRGGYTTTSSEACQTVYPDQYDGFIVLVKSEISRYQVVDIPYVLTERPNAPTSPEGAL